MERYQRVGVLGRGAFGTVVLVRLRPGGAGPLQAPEDAQAPAPFPSPAAGGAGGLPRARPRGEEEEPGERRAPPPGASPVAAYTRSGTGLTGDAEDLQSPAAAGLLRVVKEIELRGDETRRVKALREAEVLKSLSHPNIIAYHEALLVDTRLCIVMEYADGGDLSVAVARRRAAGRRFLEREAMTVFAQLAFALEYIHERRILHRDLKSKNVFLTRAGVVKIGDFGIAKVFGSDDSFTETQVGTPYYLPPEMCANQPYGFPADVWCLGIVFYELLALEVPFSAPTVPALANKICHAEPGPVPASYSGEARGLLARMLSKRAEERPTSAEIVALPHVRRCAAGLPAAARGPMAAAAAGSPGGAAGASPPGQEARAAPARMLGAGGGAGAFPASGATAGTLSDLDLDDLLLLPGAEGGGDQEEDLLLPRFPSPPTPISPEAGEGSDKPSRLPLDTTLSCEQLLHELEQEFNLA